MVPKQCAALTAVTQHRTTPHLTSDYCAHGAAGAVRPAPMEVAPAHAGAVPTPQHDGNVAADVPNIRTVLVYFTVGVRHEEALFYSNTPPEQIKDLFRAAAEASPRDILKLYNRTGQLLNINAGLEPNTPTTRYGVQVVAAHGCAMLEERAAVQLRTLEVRIADIERQLKADPPLPDAVRQLQRQVDAFRDKLETTENLSWLGFNKQLPMPVSTEECRRLKYRRKSDSIKKQVKMNFANICDSQVSDLVREDLRMPSFDSTQWEDEELLWLLQQMYLDFDLCSKFAVDIETLRNFLYEAYKNYNEVPFHNFRHCFCVAQMMYAICWAVDLPSKIGHLEILILLTSCICHDLDHPGYNNIYQINAKTELALRYNDISPLENHHCSVAFRILENDDCNLFRSFASDTFKTIREGIIRSILATDMARHNEILAQFKDTVACFDYGNKHHLNLLCMVLIKVSDISNEARPMDVAEPWLDKLLLEFFKQSDAEKLEGLPVTPFMDRDRITKPSSQCSFIGFVLLPLFETLAELLTELQDLIVQPVRDALDYYKRLNDATKEERLQRKSIVAELNAAADLSPAHSTQGGLGKSASSLRLKKSLSFQTNRSRSRSTDTEDNMLAQSVQVIDHDDSGMTAGIMADDTSAVSLSLLPEDDDERVLDSDGELMFDEDSETNTVTEVEASERALKFKINTEGANATCSSFSGTSLLSGCQANTTATATGRKSYPGSRKGSRERVTMSTTTTTNQQQQQQQSCVHPHYRAPGKLQKAAGTLSFDHQYGDGNNVADGRLGFGGGGPADGAANVDDVCSNPPPPLKQQQLQGNSTKRTTTANFLLKTLKRHNGSGSGGGGGKCCNKSQSAAHNGNTAAAALTADADHTDQIGDSLLGSTKDTVKQLCDLCVDDAVGGSTSFLSRFKHFTYDRLGLLGSSTGALDKCRRHADKEDGGGGGGVVHKMATLKNFGGTRMTLPLMRHKHKHAAANVPSSLSTQDKSGVVVAAAAACCKSLDNVDQHPVTAVTVDGVEHAHAHAHHHHHHHHHRLHKASTLPKMRKLGLGARKHWRSFFMGGGSSGNSGSGNSGSSSGGGGSKRHSRDGEGAGETLDKKATADGAAYKPCAWRSNCNVAVPADQWQDVDGGGGGGPRDSTRSLASTSSATAATAATHVTMTEYYARMLKKQQQNKTESPRSAPITVAPSLNRGGGGGGNTAPTSSASSDQSADVAVM